MANLLRNPGFNDGPPRPATALKGQFTAGDSAAPEWTVWNNNQGPNDVPLTTTDVLPSTRPVPGAGSMIHVDTLGAHNGIVQVFGTIGAGPERTEATAWVYVLRGRVGIGTGNGGNLSDSDGESTTIGRWEQIVAPRNGVSPAKRIRHLRDVRARCVLLRRRGMRRGPLPLACVAGLPRPGWPCLRAQSSPRCRRAQRRGCGRMRHAAKVLAVAALVLACAGGASAAGVLITSSKQIRNGVIAQADLDKPTRAKLNRPGVPGPAGPAGATGAQGPAGPAGAPEPRVPRATPGQAPWPRASASKPGPTTSS